MKYGFHYSNVGSFIFRAWVDVLQSEMEAPFRYKYMTMKKARAQVYGVWFPLLEHGKLYLSCMRICYELLFNLGVTLYFITLMYLAKYFTALGGAKSKKQKAKKT